MSKLIKPQDYLRKFFLLVLLTGLISLGAIGGCNDNNATGQGGEELQVDFLVDILTGEVAENPDGEGFILELEVLPITVFIEERPGNTSGVINTQDFLEGFNESAGAVPPNAILALTQGESTVAVSVALNNAQFDATESVARFVVTPLDTVTDPGPMGISAELIDIEDLESPIGRALLFIDKFKISIDGPKIPPVLTPDPGPTIPLPSEPPSQ